MKKKNVFIILIILIVFIMISNKLLLKNNNITGIWKSTVGGDSIIMFNKDNVYVAFYQNKIIEGNYKLFKNTINLFDSDNNKHICNITKENMIICDTFNNFSFVKKKTTNISGDIKQNKMNLLSSTTAIKIIDVNYGNDDVKRVITDSNEIYKVIDIINRSELLEDNEIVWIPQNYSLNFMNDHGNLITSIGVWGNRQLIIGDGVNNEKYMITDEDAIKMRKILK